MRPPNRADAPQKNPPRLSIRQYFRDSKQPLTATVAVLPLLLFYQIGLLGAGGLQNGVDFVSRTLTSLFGGAGYLGLQVLVLVGFAFAVMRLRTQGRFHPKLLPLMWAESAVYALLFGSVVVGMMRMLGLGALLGIGMSEVLQSLTASAAAGVESNLWQKLVMSAGAGFYEELVFRVLMTGGLYALATKFMKLREWTAAVLAVLLSSLIFSAVHHLGALGDPFTLQVFTYRLFAGILFAVLYRARGFAVAAYTHAFYDVYVMVFRGG
jgi:membrane protease YdiL (CAAX protease family)